jgi:hypothetical protein
VEVLVAESAEAGTNLTHVQPSTLIAVDPDNAALRAAAAVLAAKLAAMVEVVFGE